MRTGAFAVVFPGVMSLVAFSAADLVFRDFAELRVLMMSDKVAPTALNEAGFVSRWDEFNLCAKHAYSFLDSALCEGLVFVNERE